MLFVSVVDPGTGACSGGRQPSELPVRESCPQCITRSGFCVERLLFHAVVLRDRSSAALRHAVFQCLQPSRFWSAEHGSGGHPGKPSTQPSFGALTYTLRLRPYCLGVEAQARYRLITARSWISWQDPHGADRDWNRRKEA